MGYDGLFFARNDYDDRNQRLKDNTMGFVWRPSWSLGDESDIFTEILFFHYGPPPGFCFDAKCTDPPIQVLSIVYAETPLVIRTAMKSGHYAWSQLHTIIIYKIIPK